MKKNKAAPSLLTRGQARYHQHLKKFKKKKFCLKAKLSLTILLPVVITLIASKVIKTFLHIKIRDIFTQDTKKTSVLSEASDIAANHPIESPSLPKAPLKPEPAHTEPIEKIIMTPEPIQK